MFGAKSTNLLLTKIIKHLEKRRRSKYLCFGFFFFFFNETKVIYGQLINCWGGGGLENETQIIGLLLYLQML